MHACLIQVACLIEWPLRQVFLYLKHQQILIIDFQKACNAVWRAALSTIMRSTVLMQIQSAAQRQGYKCSLAELALNSQSKDKFVYVIHPLQHFSRTDRVLMVWKNSTERLTLVAELLPMCGLSIA